ncbi:MAG TPA: response regulator [Polyangiales bacterium]|nr:response regulator [Polyangiales bacterium]
MRILASADEDKLRTTARNAAITPLRLLIVDDYDPSTFAMTIALRRRGYVCQRATSPAEALDATREFRPDIALVEWALGRGTGVGLARKLRALAETSGHVLVVVAVSTQDEPPDFSEREDVDGYFVKPVEMAAFTAELVRLARR